MGFHKVAAIIVRNKRFLAVKEYDANMLLTPGGLVEGTETAYETLKRELKEELNVELVTMTPFGLFYDNKEDLTLEAYFAEINGEPEPNSEIEKIFYVNSKFQSEQERVKIPVLMKEHIIPKLVEMRLID